MPMYEVKREEQGVQWTTYRVFADDQETAEELIWEDDIQPESTYFKQHDANTYVEELEDCECITCEQRGPWTCELDDDQQTFDRR